MRSSAMDVCPAIGVGEDFAWTESGHGFAIPLRFKGEHLAVLEVDDLTFVEYKDRYLALALPLARVCSLAVATAREQEIRFRSEQACGGWLVLSSLRAMPLSARVWRE